MSLSPFEVAKHLCITQEFAEVNMKQMTRGLQHNIVIVTITDTEYICCNAVAGARNWKKYYCNNNNSKCC